jgi:FMN phosphatase YigB (HAD superfamily)
METTRDHPGTGNFDAVLFDAGGILVLPDPTVLGPLLEYYGGDRSLDRHVRAHYRAMAVKSAAGAGEAFWDEYNLAYVESIGVAPEDQVAAAHALGRTRNALLWRWPVPDSMETLRELERREVPIGVVSNASGQIEEVLARSGVCQVGDGRGCSMRVIVDSHVVGFTKPDPRIFDVALEHFTDFDRSRIGYVGDSVTMDIEGGRAAGLHPILLDPFDDHDGADFDRIQSLRELL